MAGILLISPPPPYVKSAPLHSSPPFFSTFFQARSSKNTRRVGKPLRVWLNRSTLPSPVSVYTHLHVTKLSGGPPTVRFGTPRSGSVGAYLSKPGKSFSQPCPHLLKFFLMLHLRTNQLSSAPVNSLLIVWKGKD